MRPLGSLFNSAVLRAKSLCYESKDFRTNRHIVIFESDDWGSIRMSNRKDWEALRTQGYAVDKRPYERYDTLESADDMSALFDVLQKYKDYNGRHPAITANMLMANPDFEKVEQSGYRQYCYEPIADTYTRYYGGTKVLDLMRQGIDNGVFMPQSHGREHFNVAQWLRQLQSGNEDVLTAFRCGMCGIAPKLHPEQGNKLMVALSTIDEKEDALVNEALLEGLSMFEQLWGFKSRTFVAPCYAWTRSNENVLSENGVELIQTSRYCKPMPTENRRFFSSGRRNDLGQYYSIRNCTFEPSTDKNFSIESVLHQVLESFKSKRIAVICSHRINYVGGLDIRNREKTLKSLDAFLKELVAQYPDVEFLSSDSLIEVFSNENSNTK